MGHVTALSVIILTHNEEANLPTCLDTLSELDAEIFVVDSGSTDRTSEIARNAGCQLFENPFENYATQRNWAFDNLPIKTKWLLCLDAGERLTPELAREISSVVNSPVPLYAGYMFRKRTVFMGKWLRHGGQYPSYHLRLFKNGCGRCENRLYDQHFVVEGAVGKLKHDCIDVIAPDLSRWTARHNTWASLEAQEILAQQRHVGPRIATVRPKLFGNAIERRRFLRAKVYQRLPPFIRALCYWIYAYILRLGFLDGIPGLIYYTLQRFWFRFLVDAKLYELKPREDKRGSSE